MSVAPEIPLYPARINVRNEVTWAFATVLIILPFFLQALFWSSDPNWPRDWDLLRNAGHAQTIADGHFGADPIYENELSWYPPLIPWAIAVASKTTGIPIITISAKWGAWFNLVALLMTTMAVRRMLGRRIALAALAAFLFLLDGGLNTYSEVGLSPLLDPINAMQGLFSIGLLALVWAGRTNTPVWAYAIAGFIAGVIFLGHPSASMIIAGTCVCAITVRLASENGLRAPLVKAVKRLLLFGLPMLALSMIVLFPLYQRYGLKLENAHFAWIYGKLSPGALPRTLVETPIVPLLIAIHGMAVAIQRRNNTDVVLLSAMMVAVFLFLWSTVSGMVYLQGTNTVLPMLVLPSYHFFYFIKLLGTFFFGMGSIPSFHWLNAMITQKTGNGVHKWIHDKVRSFGMMDRPPSYSVVILLAGMMGAFMWWSFKAAKDPSITFNNIRADSPGPDIMEAYDHIMDHTRTEDVFLANDMIGLTLISPTGRKLVANHPLFSNPYVDVDKRAADRDRLFSLIGANDSLGFMSHAAAYRVSYAVITPADRLDSVGLGFELVHKSGDLAIYRLPR